MIKRVGLALLAALCLALPATPGFAKDHLRGKHVPALGNLKLGECISGEYVLTASSAPSVRAKMLQTTGEQSTGALNVLNNGERAVLVSDSYEQRSQKRPARDLCGKLQEHHRSAVRKSRAARKVNLEPQYHCSCNSKLTLLKTPNDNYFSLEWGLNQTNNVDIDAPEAWDITTGSSDTVVAIIDTGIDYTQGDLQGNLWQNPGEIPGNGIDDDNDGYVDDIYGANMITGSGDPRDDNGHGTHVAGTIGARTNNGVGVAGVNWNVKIMAVKFLDSSGSGSLYGAIDALDYVTSLRQRGVNVKVTNNSWGGGGTLFQPLYDAVSRTNQAGMLFVAAAGNSTINCDSSPQYPASFGLSNVVSVAAVDSNGNLASFSNYGANSVHIAAPGVSIASTYLNNQYMYMSGTSMACPHVAGALGLLASYNSSLSIYQLKDTLLNSARSLSTLSGVVQGSRFLNLKNMLTQAPPPSGTPGTTPTVAPTSSPGPTAPPTPSPYPTSTPLPTVTPTPSPTPTPVAPPPYRVSGRVFTNGNGEILGAAGALVTLNFGAQTWQITADSDGNFDFGKAINSVGTYSLVVTFAGYDFSEVSGTINKDQVWTFYGTQKTYTLSGVIVNPAKQPLEGIYVDGGTLGEVVTDSNGKFSFTVHYGESYDLIASKLGYGFDQPELSGTVHGDVERVFVGYPG